MKIAPVNSTNSYQKQTIPNFGMALKITEDGAEYIRETVKGLTGPNAEEFLRKIENVQSRQFRNPVELKLGKDGFGCLMAQVGSKKFIGFLPTWRTDMRALKKAEEYADRLSPYFTKNETSLSTLLN